MDDSRAYYQRIKQYDPYRELWKSLVERSSKDPSLLDFTRAEKTYFTVGLLEGEVYNGGFDQLFWNSAGNYYKIALDGLEEIGATASLRIAREAARVIFGRSEPSPDQRKRWRILKSKTYRLQEFFIGHRKRLCLEALDKQFCADPDTLNDRLTSYANPQELITPFLKDDGGLRF
ncbi:DMP19 family protein [Novosphingobium sp. TW-4]|uniref:DMP19 family protein n=1 Tax=Novosphingobium olei TaxID=2728851 RepID=A0A7Y0GB14_9SPHN|nr:DMP19 family protein [Novosphingobium olei]